MAKTILKEVAYARSGDKGDVATIGIIAKNHSYYEQLKLQLTPEKVKDFWGDMVQGEVEVFPEDNMEAFQILLHRGLGGGATRTLRYDSTAKSYGCAMLRMEVDIEEV